LADALDGEPTTVLQHIGGACGSHATSECKPQANAHYLPEMLYSANHAYSSSDSEEQAAPTIGAAMIGGLTSSGR
jgi:hypothetical protein